MQRQLGVATFLILEKQQHLAGAAKEKKQPPEGERGTSMVWIAAMPLTRPRLQSVARCFEQTSPHAACSPHCPNCPLRAGVKRLYDLVNCKNDQHRIAFYYAMRDTVVAQVG